MTPSWNQNGDANYSKPRVEESDVYRSAMAGFVGDGPVDTTVLDRVWVATARAASELAWRGCPLIATGWCGVLFLPK
jgi:hypothetical protein